MKTTRYINYSLVSTWAFLGLLGILEDGFLFAALLFAVIVGLFQGITGLFLFLYRPKSTRFQIYAGGLALFGILCFIPSPGFWLWTIPPIPLALYFTFMMYTLKRTTT